MPGENDVQLSIDLAGDAAEKAERLADALARVREEIKSLSGQARIDLETSLESARQKLDQVIRREQVRRATQALDPERVIRGPDPRETRAASGARRNQEMVRRREASVRTQEELEASAEGRAALGGFISGQEADYAADVSNRQWAAQVRRRKEAAFEKMNADVLARQASARAEDVESRLQGALVQSARRAAFEKMDVGTLARQAAERAAETENRRQAAVNRQRLEAEFTEADVRAGLPGSWGTGQPSRSRRGGGGGGGAAGGRRPTAGDDRRRNLLAGTGFARIATPIFLIHAAAQTFEGLVQGIGEFTKTVNRGTDVTATYFRGVGSVLSGFLERVPIIGTAIKGAEQYSNIATGVAEQEQVNVVGRQALFRGFGAEQAGARARFQSEEETRSRQQEIAEAVIRQRAAGGFAAYLQRPGVAQSFANVPVPFVASEALDRARLAESRAGFQVGAARDVSAERQNAADLARARSREADAAYQRVGQQYGLSRNRLEEIQGQAAAYDPLLNNQTVHQNLQMIGLRERNAPDPLSKADLTREVGQRERLGAADAERVVEAANEAHQRRLELLEKEKQALAGQQDLLKAQSNEVRAQVATREQRVGLLKQEYQGAREREAALGMGEQAERLNLVAAVRQAQGQGWESLAPNDKALLSRFFPEVARQLAIQSFLKSPEAAELGRIAPGWKGVLGPEGQGARSSPELARQIYAAEELPGPTREGQGPLRAGPEGAVPAAVQGAIQLALDETQATTVMTRALTASFDRMKDSLFQLAQDAVRIHIANENIQRAAQQRP